MSNRREIADAGAADVVRGGRCSINPITLEGGRDEAFG